MLKKRMAPPLGATQAFPIDLSTKTKLLDDIPGPLDVNFLEIIQNLTALTDETEQGAACYHVLLVLLHVLGKMSDTVGK